MLEYLIEDKFVSKDDRIAVAVSGGADSMLLLWALIDKQKQAGFYIEVLHVNHNLRGEESERDSKFVKDFCEKKKVPYKILSVDAMALKKSDKLTLEEAARQARYDAIYKQMQKDNLGKLFLAHHKNDQAETVLMHILRGSGLSGACGMRENGKIFRPLLALKKSEIEKLATEHGIKFVTDSSNADTAFTRNFLRNKVFPEIATVYPQAVDSICEFASKCLEVQTYIENQVNNEYIDFGSEAVSVDLRALSSESFIVKEYFKRAFALLGNFADIEDKHYKLILSLKEAEVNTSIDLPHGFAARKTYNSIKIYKKSQNKEEVAEDVLFKLGTISVNGMQITAEIVDGYSVNYGDGNLYVDLNKLPSDSVWRLRKTGDKFTMLGMGTRSLSDYFTDEKVDFDLRNNLPVLASKDRVLVVASRDISENVKVEGTTDSIVKLSFNKITN